MGFNQKGTANLQFFSILLFAVAGGLFYFAFFYEDQGTAKMSSRTPNPVSANSAEAEKVVNKYLKDTNKAIELQKMNSEVQNRFVIPKVGDVLASRPDSNKRTVQVGEGNPGSPDTGMTYDINSPSAQIQNDLAEQQRLDEYDQKYKEEYIRQFVENARKNGWKLVVDENGVIKSSTPLKTEERPRLFDGPSRLSNQ